MSLASYAYFGNVFTARKVFIVTSYFNFLYFSLLHYWPLGVSTVSETRISINRIQEFLLMPENKAAMIAVRKRQAKNATAVNTNNSTAFKGEIALEQGRLLDADGKNSTPTTLHRITCGTEDALIRLENATAGWLDEKAGLIRGIENASITVLPGKLCAIIGTVGSGKSTLLQVILGELELDAGTLLVNGTVSYAPQEPWLFEGSVRQNILFGAEYDAQRYREVINVCSLGRDLQLLPHGDRTIVGERGASLSGGQRARVSLARAVYKKADIYLLDDPLSAVDTHVGKHIFEKCVRSFLGDRICVLVTHQLQLLKDVEHLVLMNGGFVAGQDTFQHLKESKAHALLWNGNDDDEDDVVGVEKNAESLRPARISDARKISCTISLKTSDMNAAPIDTTQEAQIHGSIGIRVLISYFGAANNRCFVAVVLALFIVAQACISSVDWLVSRW